MGRRKERRLAAMGATGRRVKLDLFAEPTGDSVGSSAQEEVGGDGDSKSHAELPDSPSSSGQKPQNPLLLLEQYSDEELDSDSKEVHQDATAEQASLAMEEQSKAATVGKAGATEINNEKDPIEGADELLINKASATSQCLSEKPQKESIIDLGSSDLQNQTDKIKNSPDSAGVDEQLVGDVNLGWKMVLHEESNQYYYWNVTTGETSWEVPEVLAQQTVDTSAEKDIRDTEEIMDALMSTYESSIPLGTAEDDITASADPNVNSETSNSVHSGRKKDDECGSTVIKFKEENGDANQDGTSLLGEHSVEGDSAANSSLQLIKYCESLLERLDSVKSLDYNLEGQDLKLKYILEIEIRLADIKALSSYQSSLLPFWLHSKAQLKRLEADVDCVIQRVNPASLDGSEAAQVRHEGIGDDAKINSSETKALFATLESHIGDTMKKSMLETHNDGATTMEHDLCEKIETIVTEKESESNHRPLHSVEDMDMDVDMEVEDTSPMRSPHAGGLGACYHVSKEPLGVQSTLSDKECNVPGHDSVPTNEDWIPPPPPGDEPFPPLPPDDEPFPPPPPDEPPEALYLPSSFSFAQAIPYSGEYTLSYPGPGLEYYVQTNPEVSGSTFYAPSEGGQVAIPHVPHYYEAGPNIYPVAPAIVNPVETTSYYGLQNGTTAPVSLMHSTAESSGAKGEPASGDTGALGSLDSHPEAGSSLLLNNNSNVEKSFYNTVVAPSEVPEARRSPATSSMANGSPVASTSDTTASISSSAASAAAAAAAAAAAMKSQPKARTKKRAVAVGSTLKSNKKVSSMVDKWKAAKEELREEDDEPKDAYEILEKKRQREIEQWHANQIASGEAKDNANFQPLGGDWRERVKRRRAQKKKESSPEVSVAADKNQQPDLIGLSKGLPSGWQAYWDDSSKQVYYGHVLTSVTSWVRPTD